MKKINKYISPAWGLMAALLFLNATMSACKKANPVQPSSVIITTNDLAKKILFVGNSLTYYNDLPNLVAKIGKDSGVEIKAEMIAYPNYALEDHWNNGAMQALIAGNKYDFVVVQQGPSSQAEGRAMLLDYGARIKNICTPQNTKLAFFMVWPAFANYSTFDGVIQNYSDAAAVTNSLLCPVGQVWKNHFQSTGDYSYYGPDMFHPSHKGSENAALIIFKTLFP